ncbi:MAG: MFS transporter [Verrucomicrobiaceae bacterium]|nr:MFS transporter [Verrucomicrobiaceae bacterium]
MKKFNPFETFIKPFLKAISIIGDDLAVIWLFQGICEYFRLFQTFLSVNILGAAPFALIMPYANLTWTIILSMVIAFVMSSAFSAILVYAQELFPKKVGMVSGLFFGLAFGFGGIMSAVLGNFADSYGIDVVYKMMAFVPLLGIVAYYLPRVRTLQAMKRD